MREWVRGGVRETQGAQGQLTFSKGPEWMGNSPPHEKGIAFPIKLLLLAIRRYAPTYCN
jgi:hypothetical protein